jgi:DNA polymerase IV
MILHVDCDAFFVSVEELHDPSLKGKPVVVGAALEYRDGRWHAPRGVVSAASYAARKFGVHSAMPLVTAYRLCPQAIFVPGHYDRYVEMSRRIKGIFQRFSPAVSMASIDEAYLDLTGSERLLGTAYHAATQLHEAIARETGLPCSIGVSSSRLVSKVASDQAKPNGVLWIPPGMEAAFLAPLSVRRIPGIGKVGEQRLAHAGIKTVADAAAAGSDALERVLGENGASLFRKSQGEDAGGWFTTPVGVQEAAKSISHETTFSVDNADREELLATLSELSQMVARRLREQDLFARTVALKLRTSDFHTITRAHTLAEPTSLDGVIYENIKRMFELAWRGNAVRLLGVRAADLDNAPAQMNFLEEPGRRKWEKALAAADRLRDRFGFGAVQLGGALRPDGTPALPPARIHDNPAELRAPERPATPDKSPKNAKPLKNAKGNRT